MLVSRIDRHASTAASLAATDAASGAQVVKTWSSPDGDALVRLLVFTDGTHGVYSYLVETAEEGEEIPEGEAVLDVVESVTRLTAERAEVLFARSVANAGG